MTLVRARALENTIYVAAADQNAPTGSGHSVIVDPIGLVLASLGNAPAPRCRTERERLAEVRTKNPALELRRLTVPSELNIAGTGTPLLSIRSWPLFSGRSQPGLRTCSAWCHSATCGGASSSGRQAGQFHTVRRAGLP